MIVEGRQLTSMVDDSIGVLEWHPTWIGASDGRCTCGTELLTVEDRKRHLVEEILKAALARAEKLP